MPSRSPTVSRMGFAFALAGLAACSPDAPTVPSQLQSPELRHAVENGLTVLNAQLRPVGTTTSEAYGHIQLKFFPTDPLLPPNPISVAITGRIFNPELEALSGEGGIFELPDIFGDGGGLVAAFDAGLPPSPIRNSSIDATISISSDLATALSTSRAGYSITIGNLEGRMVRGGPPI